MFTEFDTTIEARERQASYVYRAAIPPSYFLTIPRIDSEVPAVYSQLVHPSIALLAERLAGVGVISKDDIVKNEDVDIVIRQAVSREMTKATGTLDLIAVSAHFEDGFSAAEYGESQCEGNELSHVKFAIACEHVEILLIGKAIDALELLLPGLGQTMFAVLSQAAFKSLGLFTLEHVFEHIPYMFGLDDDYEESEEGEDDDDDDGETRLTKEEWLEGSPLWIAKPQLIVDRPTVTQLCDQESTPVWAVNILKASLAVAEAYVSGESKLGDLSGASLDQAYQLAIVRLSEDDQVERAADDFIQQANYCSDSYTELMHCELVNLVDADQFLIWWEGVLSGCRLLGAIDVLMTALTCQPTQEG